MGFGIGLGPRVFRVRVSTRGLGVSSGVGPFSVYTHSRRRRRRSSPPKGRGGAAPKQTGPTYRPGDTRTTNLIGAGAQELTPTGSNELVEQLNRAQMWVTGGGWAAGVSLFLSFGTPWLLVPSLAITAIATVGFFRRRVLLDYEVDPELLRWFDALVDGWPTLASTQGRWRAQTNTRLHQTHHRKVNAGAGNLVTRHPVTFRSKTPMALRTNLVVPTIKAKRHSLMFLPDRMLVKTGVRWSDVDYNFLRVSVSQSHFIEDGAVPRDGTQVGETWQYVNVKGGPDRRFKNNRRLPVMLYSAVSLTSPQGLRWDLSLSRHDVATWWSRVLLARPKTPDLLNSLSPDTKALDLERAPLTTTPEGEVKPIAKDQPRSSGGTGHANLGSATASGVSAAPDATARRDVNPDDCKPDGPTGEPFEPWGIPWTRVEIASESDREQDVEALFAGVAGYSTSEGAALHESAILMPGSYPQSDGHTIAVFIRGHHVGYLPHEKSAHYFATIKGIAERDMATTVGVQVWASSNYYETGFRCRITLSLPRPNDFDHPNSMPDGNNTVILPAGKPLQVTGEEAHTAFLLPFVGQHVAVTLHNARLERRGKTIDLVEARINNEPVGTFTPSTSLKVSRLVNVVENVGGLCVARATVAGNSSHADVTVYVARSSDVPQEWFDRLSFR